MSINWQRIPFGNHNGFISLMCVIAMYVVGYMQGWQPKPTSPEPCACAEVDAEEVEP